MSNTVGNGCQHGTAYDNDGVSKRNKPGANKFRTYVLFLTSPAAALIDLPVYTHFLGTYVLSQFHLVAEWNMGYALDKFDQNGNLKKSV